MTQRQKKKISLEYTEKKFIASPTDIDVHRKVDLQDVDIAEEQKKKSFKELCDKYKDIFYRFKQYRKDSFDRDVN